MDVGGAYRQLLEQKMPRIADEVPAIAKAYMAYARSQLAYDAYQAKLEGRLDETGERLLAHVGVHLEDRRVAPWPVRSRRWSCSRPHCLASGCTGD